MNTVKAVASYTLRHNREHAICARLLCSSDSQSQTPQIAVEMNGADLCAELGSSGCPTHDVSGMQYETLFQWQAKPEAKATSAISRVTDSNMSPVSALAEWKWDRSGRRDWAALRRGRPLALKVAGKGRGGEWIECFNASAIFNCALWTIAG